MIRDKRMIKILMGLLMVMLIVPSIGLGDRVSLVDKLTIVEKDVSQPGGMVYSKENKTLIFVDTYNHSIKSLNLRTLAVKTIAGRANGIDIYENPMGGYEDGSLYRAMFNKPRGLALGQNGAIIVADTGNHAIRQIYNGRVTTLAGGEKAGFKDGKGTGALFNSPSDVKIDKENNIYVADTLNNAIRKIDSIGRVTSLLGNPDDTTILHEPSGLLLGPEEDIYIVDSGNHQIKKLLAKDEFVLVLGNKTAFDKDSGYFLGGYLDGPEDLAYLNFPKSIAMDQEGNILIADTYNHVIRKLEDNRLETILGSGRPGSNQVRGFKISLDGPASILYVEKTLFIGDRGNNRILIIPDKDDNLGKIEADYEPIRVYMDGNRLIFPDVKPDMGEDKLWIPIRPIIEAWQGIINWDGTKKEININKEDQEYKLSLEDGDYILKDSRALVDMDTLEAFELNLIWIEEEGILSIQSK